MAYQSHSAVTMAPSLPVPSLQNLPLTGTSTIAPVHLPTLTVMARQKQLWIWSRDYLHDPSTQDEIPTLPYLPTTVPLWMHTCTHLVRCSTSMLVHNSATAYLPYWPTCYCWMWPSRPACLPECGKPQPSRLLTESPTLCQTVCICSQWCQMPVAPCHCHPYSRPWIIHCPSHQQWIILTCPQPHTWASLGCHQAWQACHHKCSSHYTHMPTCHPGSATSTMCCTCNISASCNTLHTMEDTHCAHASPCTVSNTKADWHSTCCPSPFCLEQ